MGTRFARVVGFDAWLRSAHSIVSASGKAGRTSYAYIVLRRFLRPDGPIPTVFRRFEHAGDGEWRRLFLGQRTQTRIGVKLSGPSACAVYPDVCLTLYPDTDAAATARYCAARLGVTAQPAATADFTSQLRRFLAAHVSVRVDTSALESAGLGRLHVTVAPSESAAEAVVSFRVCCMQSPK
eukprot:COSAG01_NODE_9354_length_2472_cov_1.749263_3_plen_181_part_00